MTEKLSAVKRKKKSMKHEHLNYKEDMKEESTARLIQVI